MRTPLLDLSLISTSVRSRGQLRLSTRTAHAASSSSSWPNPIASDTNTTVITMANAFLPRATSLSSETRQLLFFFHHPEQPSNEKRRCKGCSTTWTHKVHRLKTAAAAAAASSPPSPPQCRWTLKTCQITNFFCSLDLLLLLVVSSEKEDWRIRRTACWGARTRSASDKRCWRPKAIHTPQKTTTTTTTPHYYCEQNKLLFLNLE